MPLTSNTSLTLNQEDEDTLGLAIPAHIEDTVSDCGIPLPSDGDKGGSASVNWGHPPWYHDMLQPTSSSSNTTSSGHSRWYLPFPPSEDACTAAPPKSSSSAPVPETYSWSQLLLRTVPNVDTSEGAESHKDEESQQDWDNDDDGDEYAPTDEVQAGHGALIDAQDVPRGVVSSLVYPESGSDSDESTSTGTSEDEDTSSSHGSDDEGSSSSSESSEDEPLADLMRLEDSHLRAQETYPHSLSGEASGSQIPDMRCDCTIHKGSIATFEDQAPIPRVNRTILRGEAFLQKELAKPSWCCHWRHCRSGHKPGGDPHCKRLGDHIRRLCLAARAAGEKNAVCGWENCQEKNNTGDMRRHVLQHFGYLRWLCPYCNKEWARSDEQNRHFRSCKALKARRDAGDVILKPVAVLLYEGDTEEHSAGSNAADADTESERSATAHRAGTASTSSAAQEQGGARKNATGTRRRRRSEDSDDEGNDGDDDGSGEWKPTKCRKLAAGKSVAGPSRCGAHK